MSRRKFPKTVVKAPTEYKRLGNDFVQVIFLGGGISGCGDWQATMEDLLTGLPVIQINPRRENFDITDPAVSIEQIKWEHRHLKQCNCILFWFPCETLCPITLFELGRWLHSKTKVFVGVHPDYKRRLDVEIQSRLERPKLEVAYSLDALAQQVWDHYGYDRKTGKHKSLR